MTIYHVWRCCNDGAALEGDGRNGYICPVCGCSTSSPADDACTLEPLEDGATIQTPGNVFRFEVLGAPCDAFDEDGQTIYAELSQFGNPHFLPCTVYSPREGYAGADTLYLQTLKHAPRADAVRAIAAELARMIGNYDDGEETRDILEYELEPFLLENGGAE